MGNGINLSNAVVETYRERISEITTEKAISSYRVHIMLYPVKKFPIIEADKTSAVVLNNAGKRTWRIILLVKL